MTKQSAVRSWRSKKEITKEMRKLEGYKNMDETIKNVQKENRQKELAPILIHFRAWRTNWRRARKS